MGADIASRKLIVEVLGDSKSLERALGRSTKASQQFETGLKGSAQRVDSLFTKTQKIAAGGFLGGVAVTAAVKGIQTTVGAASDLNEQITKNQQVFGASAQAVEQWSKSTAQSIGISQSAALEATGTFGNLFAAIGIGSSKAADTSERLVQLAADLASFNNADPSEVLLALRSGLAGEAEPLRRFGVLLSEARVQQEALRETGKKHTDDLTNQEKTLARVAIIFHDTAKAQGDFARTSEGLANQQRILKARLADTEAEIGQKLLPIMVRGAEIANQFFDSLHPPATATDLIGEDFRNKFADAFGMEALKELLVNLAPQIRAAAAQLQETIKPLFGLGDTLQSLVAEGNKKAASAAAAGKKKGFGTGLTPEDLFGPLIKDITPALNEQLLDAQISGNQKRIRAVLVKIQASLTDALDDPRLKREGRIKIKTALESIVGQIKSIDTAAQSAADQAASTARTNAAKRAAKAKKAAAAVKKAQRAGFDALVAAIGNQIDAAELTPTFKDNISKGRKLVAAINAQIKVEGRTAELIGDLADAKAKVAQAVADQAQARQFKSIGLGPTGDDLVPGAKSLQSQFAKITAQISDGTIKLGGKLTKQIEGIGRLLAGLSGPISEDTAAAVQKIFDAVTDTIDKNTNKKTGPLTKTTSLNVAEALSNVTGLNRDQIKQIRANLSSFNSANIGLAGTRRPTGGFGSQPIVVESHTTVNLDGEVVGRNVTRSQQKASRRNPPQRRGPNARSGV